MGEIAQIVDACGAGLSLNYGREIFFRTIRFRMLFERLAAKGLTISTAESLTAGNIQALIATETGISTYFKGGVTAYTIPIKAKLLGVDQEEALRVNAVSERVVEDMALGAQRLFESDIAVATTGYAEPYPDMSIELPFAYYAIAMPGDARPVVYRWTAPHRLPRIQVQQTLARQVIDTLVMRLDEFNAS